MKPRLLLLATAILFATSCNDERIGGFFDDVIVIDARGADDSVGFDDLADPEISPDPDTSADAPDDGSLDPPDINSDMDTAVDIDPDTDSNMDSDMDSDTEIRGECGDGVVDDMEECDDGIENSDMLPDACRTDCSEARCGDGTIDSGEACDDGNDVDDDECSNNCTSIYTTLCIPCDLSTDCGRDEDRCLTIDDGNSFCLIDCSAEPCPAYFVCQLLTDSEGEAIQQCVPESGTCEPCLDLDGDGYGIGFECLGYDCDDADDTVNAGAVEICDGIDNDCDRDVDESSPSPPTWFADADEDGWGDGDSYVERCHPEGIFTSPDHGDCDDDDPSVNPDGTELCNGRDDDCDAGTPDGAHDPGVGIDCDGDDLDMCASGVVICIDEALVCVEEASDTRELCDGRDNDCNPETPDGAEDDRIGLLCDGEDSDLCIEGVVICVDGVPLCDDFTGDDVEVCDDDDNDCDGEIDNDAIDAPSWFFDRDGDGFGDDRTERVGCDSPGRDFVTRGGDCDLEDGRIHPDADEICDRLDNNCDEVIDTDAIDRETSYPDVDGDGWGDELAAISTCGIPVGNIRRGGDCLDTDANANPDEDEICDDGIDNDCNAQVDCVDTACIDSPECTDLDCVGDDLGGAIGLAVAEGSNTEAASVLDGTCAGSGREVVFVWEAPMTGEFTFDTLGSDYDTVLYALAGSCSGVEVACNDDAFSGGERLLSRITFDLLEGERLVLVLDAFSRSSTGDFQLNISVNLPEICDNGVDDDLDGLDDCFDPDCAGSEACAGLDCPELELGPAIGRAVAVGSTDGATFGFAGSCGGERAPDLTFSWTAPETGSFVFDAANSEFETTVYALGSCEGGELGCGAGALELDLEAGDEIVVVVDGAGVGSGDFELDIYRSEICDNGEDDDLDLDQDCFDIDCADSEVCRFDGCPTEDLGSNVGAAVAEGTTEDSPYAYTAGCGFTGRDASPDDFLTWTPPRSGRYAIDTFGSDFDTLLAVTDAACAGAEIACNDDTWSGESNNRSRVVIDASTGRAYTIVVSGWGDSLGDYAVNIEQIEADCEDARDEDLDGLTDCRDPDCSDDPVCAEICDNGEDDDFDDAIDCRDSDCELGEICCFDDIFEPNQGSATSPSTLPDVYGANPEATLTVGPGDVDSFLVSSLCDGAVISATLRFAHAGGNVDYRLLRAGGFQVAAGNSTTDNETLSFSVGPGVRVLFFQVFMNETGRCNQYMMSLSVDRSGCTTDSEGGA